jgi:DNA polymerase-3 subunit epsilon
MGRCPAPCDGRIDPERYGELVRHLVSSLTTSPGGLLEALERRMTQLADQERFEEAASVRDRLRTLAAALWRARQDAWLVHAGRLEVAWDTGATMRFDRGALGRPGVLPSPETAPLSLPCPRERAEELSAVRSWLARHPTRVQACDGAAPSEPVDGGAAIARILAATGTPTADRPARGRR